MRVLDLSLTTLIYLLLRRWMKSTAEVEAQHEVRDEESGSAKKILGMEIIRARKEGMKILSQREYLERLICRFDMDTAKAVNTPLVAHIKLSVMESLPTDGKKEYIFQVPHASVVGSLMYVMVCT